MTGDIMRATQISLDKQESLSKLSDDEFQALLLEGVSRTFAMTIPELPKKLYSAVAGAYLLCRIVDTIEDEVSLSLEQKQYFCSEFIRIVKTGTNSEPFALELAPLLSGQTIPAEHTLIQVLPRVIKIIHKLDPDQIEALASCIATMAEGMPIFQAKDLHGGLATLADMDRYCYYVAGCVGEMLTRLFCHYSPEIARHKDELLSLSASFGQGLQMTNILKDIGDDAARGVCWLPQDIFTETGFDLKNLTAETYDENFRKGLEHLISIAHNHLHNALKYTQLLPTHETGIRNFCLWSLGIAVLTLKKIKAAIHGSTDSPRTATRNLDFTGSDPVKITRNSVKATILATRLTGRSNTLLTLLFNLTSRKLKTPDWAYSTPSSKAK
jgi:farnesyl-diphosphate farnesyltransferase